MNFHLSDDQLALQDAVGGFVRDAMENGLRRRVFESETGFDQAFWTSLMELGVGAVAVDEAHGGLGLGLTDLALVAETLGYEAAPGPFLGHALAILAIQSAGTDTQKARWLSKLASGESIGTVALAESGDRWNSTEWALAIQNGRLAGEKTNVPYPHLADVMVVGVAGGDLVLVEMADAGIETAALDVADRTRRLWSLRLNGVSAEPMNGTPHSGAALFDQLSVLLAADAFGGAKRCLEMTTEYAKTRQQFGQPLARFQAIKHRLANLACEIEPARGLYWYAAVAQDLLQGDRSRIASLAKAHLAERFNIAVRTAVELHGGIGFTWEYELQIWVKRAMFDLAYGATPTRHRRWAMQAEAA